MKRPVGVTIISVLAIIYGAIQILASIPLLGFKISMVASLPEGLLVATSGTLGMVTGLLMLAFGVLFLAAGIGGLRLHSWAWVVGVIAFAVNTIFAVGLLFTAFSWYAVLSVAVSAGLVAYLYSHDVRTAFSHEDGSITHHSGGPSMA